MLNVEDAVTSPLEHLDFGVEAFHEATGVSVYEEIGDLIKPVI